MEDPISMSQKEDSFHDKTLNSDVNKNQEYLVMTVEIGDGRTDIIAIHEDDDPSFLAQEFANKHNLDLSLQKSLSKLIRQNKDIVEKKNNDVDFEKWSDWPGSHYASQINNKFDSFTPKINEKSRKILSKCERRGTVYDRLYQKSKKTVETKESVKTLDVTSKSRSANNINYGEWLYVRGMKMKEAAKKTVEEKKREKDDQEVKDLTFTPAINKVSSLMSPRYYEKPEEVLLKKAEATKQKIKMMKEKNDQDELKECTFAPIINPVHREKCEKTIYENLYGQAEKIKEKMLQKQENDLKQYSFAPNVQLTKKKETSDQPVHERLFNAKKEFDSKIEEIRNSRIEDIDSITGQKLFTPITESKIEPRDRPVWEILYSKDSEIKKERESYLASDKKFWEANAAAEKTTENTKKIFNDFKEKQYERIFNNLDQDKDGLISANSITLDHIDERTVLILKPLFDDLQESNIEVDFKGFIQRLEIISKTLNVDDRAHLLKRDTKPQVPFLPESKPFVSQASVKLAEKKRVDMPDDLYERLVSAQKLTEMRAQKHKEINEMFALKDCTFRPNLKKT
jgi:hypothetical protein